MNNNPPWLGPGRDIRVKPDNPIEAEAARAVGDIFAHEARRVPWTPPPRPDASPAVPHLGMIVGEANKPNHYMRFKIEPIRFIQENELSPLQGKVVKYVTRYKHKNGLVDLHKAKRCIEMLIELESGNEDWWK